MFLYRRIDKILNELLDNVWDIIEKREEENITEMNKPRPAKYENLFLLEVCKKNFDNNSKNKVIYFKRMLKT